MKLSTFFGALLMLITALSLSGVAAWFSVIGLIAIFSAAPLSVAIMGGTLEIAKLVSASWVYNNWHRAPFLLKSYLTFAVVMLMFVTSMGIFGYLSKAHLEQRASGVDTALQLQRLEQDLKVKEIQIARLTGTEDRLNSAIDRLIELDRVTQALDQRRNLQAELNSVASEKKLLQLEVDEIYKQIIPLQLVTKQLEAEVGPLRYIAELIYGDEAESHFDQAVRAVIIILVVVFDPLAVIMLIAANFGMAQARQAALAARPEPILEEVSDEPVPSAPAPETVVSYNYHYAPFQSSNLPEPEPEPEPESEPRLTTIETALKEVEVSEHHIVDRNNGYLEVDGKLFYKPAYEAMQAGNLVNSVISAAPLEGISLERVKGLIHKLESEETTIDDLTLPEREAVRKHLESNG